jgi:hypothetical protein
MTSPLTPEEYQALLTILNRAPITHAEVVALNLIIAKLAPEAEQSDGKAAT